MTAADFQAVAESIAAVAALIAVGALGWVTGLPAALVSWSRVRMRREDSLLFSREVAALPPKRVQPGGIAGGGHRPRAAGGEDGHPPYAVTQGHVSPEQPLDYLLAKVCEAVWEAVSSAWRRCRSVLAYPAAMISRCRSSSRGISSRPARSIPRSVQTPQPRRPPVLAAGAASMSRTCSPVAPGACSSG